MNTKKKIGIVTLPGNFNYGNRLQNYALKAVIEKMGFNVDTTVISDAGRLKEPLSIKIKRNLNSPIKEILKKIFNRLNFKKELTESQTLEIINNRTEIFKSFSEEHLSEQFYSLNNSSDINNLEDYLYFVVGSDQVWSPSELQKNKVYFLEFANEEKRIAYSPSISREKIPTYYNDYYKKTFESMKALSVREEAGAAIIKDLSNISAPVLVDPTMLLQKDDWMTVSKRASNRPNTPYLLTYFLGGPSDITRSKLENLAKEKNMSIINLGDITDTETYQTGPSEFLDYINNASAFFTDSFHGVVFSIIFETPFIAYERLSPGPSMYSRIETILDNFDMRNREANGFNEDVFSMDFSGTHEVLEREYNKSIDYLKEALRIEG